MKSANPWRTLPANLAHLSLAGAGQDRPAFGGEFGEPPADRLYILGGVRALAHRLRTGLPGPATPFVPPEVARLSACSAYSVESSNNLVRSEPFGSSSAMVERCAARSR